MFKLRSFIVNVALACLMWYILLVWVLGIGRHTDPVWKIGEVGKNSDEDRALVTRIVPSSSPSFDATAKLAKSIGDAVIEDGDERDERGRDLRKRKKKSKSMRAEDKPKKVKMSRMRRRKPRRSAYTAVDDRTQRQRQIEELLEGSKHVWEEDEDDADDEEQEGYDDKEREIAREEKRSRETRLQSELRDEVIPGMTDDYLNALAGNETLGFQAILALSIRPSWRPRGLQAAANLSGLHIHIPSQPPINPTLAREFSKIGPRYGEHPSIGAANAWLAHLDLIKFGYQSGLDTFLILEDDGDWDVRIREQTHLLAQATRDLLYRTPKLFTASKSHHFDHHRISSLLRAQRRSEVRPAGGHYDEISDDEFLDDTIEGNDDIPFSDTRQHRQDLLSVYHQALGEFDESDEEDMEVGDGSRFFNPHIPHDQVFYNGEEDPINSDEGPFIPSRRPYKRSPLPGRDGDLYGDYDDDEEFQSRDWETKTNVNRKSKKPKKKEGKLKEMREEEEKEKKKQAEEEEIKERRSYVPAPYGRKWDVLWLGSCREAWDHSHHEDTVLYKDHSVIDKAYYIGLGKPAMGEVPRNSRIVFRSSYPLCTFAYALTRPGARKVLDVLGSGQGEAFDVHLMKSCNSGVLNCLSVLPELFREHMPAEQFKATSEVDILNGEQRMEKGILAENIDQVMGSTENIPQSARCLALFGMPCMKDEEVVDCFDC